MRDALAPAGPDSDVQIDDAAATILHAGAPIAQVEINGPGDGLSGAERDELVEFATDADGDHAAKARPSGSRSSGWVVRPSGPRS